MDETLREFFLCICTFAARLSAVSIRIFSAGLDKNGCLDYNEFIFELNIWCLYNTHISFGRIHNRLRRASAGGFLYLLFLSHT